MDSFLLYASNYSKLLSCINAYTLMHHGILVWLVHLRRMWEPHLGCRCFNFYDIKWDFVFPCADERPAGIEDTFLLCPAPVVEEVGR